MRKSLRAVRIAGRNRYTGNTPLGSPSGTARERKRLFFWLQKSGVNPKGSNTIPGRRYNPSVFSACKQAENPAPLAQGSRERTAKPRCEICTGEPRSTVQTLYLVRGYNPSVFSACKQAENPAPLAQLAFECRRWRIQRERQAAAVRKCESEQPKHERLTAKEPRFALRRSGAGFAPGSRDCAAYYSATRT